MDIPTELIEQFAHGNGVIFVGAGLSQGAGLSGWNDLLSPLAGRIGLPPDWHTHPLRVAQYYENQFGRQALVQHVMEQIDTTGKGPTDNHHRLLRLGARTWVTTNYDDLIERTFQEASVRFTKVVRDQNLPYTSADALTLVKMHGDREQPDTIIITERDYQTYFHRFPRIRDKLAGLLLEKTFLFVGYGVDDPDFDQIRAEIGLDLHQHQRMAYAVLFDANEFNLLDLRSRNIHVVNIRLEGHTDHSRRLGELLDELIHRVDQARQQWEQTDHRTIVMPGSTPSEDVRGLLEAMGYRITDAKVHGSDLYFLCNTKWGAEVRQEVVHFVGGQPTASDIAALNDAVTSCDAARGTLLTKQPLPDFLCNYTRQRERIQCYTISEFTDRLADFRPYLERLIQEHEAGEIPSLYVALGVQREVGKGQTPQVFRPLESFVDAWLTEPERNHLSILGDFGSGKTWFCQQYAYLAAKRYLADPVHNRIPVLITLRDYSRAYDTEQLITDAVANRYRVGLAAAYKTFAQLNEAGRLLLIFDGFDEMERRVSDYRTTVENFWELARAACPASKVLLTCRTAYFRHGREEEETLAPKLSRFSVAAGNQVIDLRDQDRFDVVYLLDFGDDDIRLALQKRLPMEWEPTYQKIRELSNLRDLASRPVLLDMIVKTLPGIQNAREINQATLYETYVDALLERRWSADTDHILPPNRLFFMQELAWEMYTGQRLTIPFSEFPERVIKHFGLTDAPGRAAFFERDIRTQSYLVRDDDGNYRFAHKSFMEYFVARRMTDAVSGPSVDLNQAIQVWKTQLLTPEVQGFLLNMVIDSNVLWRIIEATRGKTIQDVGYAGSNAATLLALKKVSFKGRRLERAILVGADLSNADLRQARLQRANLRNAILYRATLRGAILEEAILRNADLWHADLRDSYCAKIDLRDARLHGVQLSNSDPERFRGALLEGADWRDTPILSLSFTPPGASKDVQEDDAARSRSYEPDDVGKHAMTKWVYSFGEVEEAEKRTGDWDDVRALLGGKGANLAEMTRIGVPVPPGFTITTEACNAYLGAGERFPDGMWEQTLEALKATEAIAGKKLGDPTNPLLVSCRSGAKFSMPGMMDTVLNIGLNDKTVAGMVELTGNETFVYNSYRRLLQMFGSVVLGIPDEPFEEAIEHRKKQKDVKDDTELTAEDWKALVEEFKIIIRQHKDFDFPQDPIEQIRLAIEAVFRSWYGKRAVDYRRAERIPDDLGTAVNVVTMVYGNMGWDSGTGVAFTRDPATGERVMYGDYLMNAQGEDVVAGTRNTKKITHLGQEMPAAYAQLLDICDKLERHYREMQDVEFTIERGKLWMLQTRNGKRTARAAIKIAVDMANEGVITKEQALKRVTPAHVDTLLRPQFDPRAKKLARQQGTYLASGIDASPGAAVGLAAFDADLAEEWGQAGKAVIMVRPDTKPDDVHGTIAAKGILTSRGGATSHAAVAARQFGKPAVVGCESINIDLTSRQMSVGDKVVKEGEWLSVDGTTGEVFAGQIATETPNFEEQKELITLLNWADEICARDSIRSWPADYKGFPTRGLQVWANADYPRDAERARKFGAKGIGLCRTEHMFFEEERLPIVQYMILADTAEERKTNLDKLLPFQRADFEGIFQAMDGLPVIIRLIDPPLHEFLPSYDDVLEQVITLRQQIAHLEAQGLRPDKISSAQKELAAKQELLHAIEGLREANPMMGLRGIRLGITIPEITQMQVRAIFEAACNKAKGGIEVHPEIMIPLTGHYNELKTANDLLVPVAQEIMKEKGIEIDYKFGTMIEIPRAAVTADQIAGYAEFFSYSTNDLTQMTFGYSRDDAERNFLLFYVEHGILPNNPFQVLDREGVGEFMKMGVKKGHSTRPELECGICGEHGGDPSSIEFCHIAGLDYVSCSSFRVPVARLAAAHAALGFKYERD